MDPFHLITEADARVLERGCTVRLAPGGHVTPLALDTLRDRRVTLVREDGVDADPGGLAPPQVARVAVAGAADQRSATTGVLAALRGLGLAADDRGEAAGGCVALAVLAAEPVAAGEADAGVVVDGDGFGAVIAANRVPGVRAALCRDVRDARTAREVAGANLLVLAAGTTRAEDLPAIAAAFVSTRMRDAARIRELAELDRLERARRRP